jgi:hypothetical protein
MPLTWHASLFQDGIQPGDADQAKQRAHRLACKIGHSALEYFYPDRKR